MSRVALVTGGTRGIGAAIARALSEAGHNVAVTFAGNKEKAEQFRGETGIAVFQWDVADESACAEGVKHVAGEIGPIDILVNNAGITRDGWFHKMDHQAWSAVLRTNLDSMFTMTRPVIDGMRERNFGRIVNISSINGQKGQIGQVNYSTAKAGVIGFTKALAKESARFGVRVNAVAPGPILAPAGIPAEEAAAVEAATPLGRWGGAIEIAKAVAFLIETDFVTGETIRVDGGRHLR